MSGALTKAVLLVCAAASLACATRFVVGPITGKKYAHTRANADNPDWGYYTEVRQEYVNTHPELPDEHKNAILQGRVLAGMTTEEVEVSWALYGPRRVGRKTLLSAGLEEWQRDWKSNPRFLYFRNGRLERTDH